MRRINIDKEKDGRYNIKIPYGLRVLGLETFYAWCLFYSLINNRENESHHHPSQIYLTRSKSCPSLATRQTIDLKRCVFSNRKCKTQSVSLPEGGKKERPQKV